VCWYATVTISDTKSENIYDGEKMITGSSYEQDETSYKEMDNTREATMNIARRLVDPPPTHGAYVRCYKKPSWVVLPKENRRQQGLKHNI